MFNIVIMKGQGMLIKSPTLSSDIKLSAPSLGPKQLPFLQVYRTSFMKESVWSELGVSKRGEVVL